jgi:hypothetical protein
MRWRQMLHYRSERQVVCINKNQYHTIKPRPKRQKQAWNLQW